MSASRNGLTKMRGVYAITAMLSQAIAFLVASGGGGGLGINLLIWFVLFNVALKLSWNLTMSARLTVRWGYLFFIGVAPFGLLALCVLISPYFDWLDLF